MESDAFDARKNAHKLRESVAIRGKLMLRKTFVIIPIILLALSGCSSKAKEAAVTGAAPGAGAA
ncbi:MAG: hypothetical protein ACRDP6_40965, partial [Actinoallomurus sp.]